MSGAKIEDIKKLRTLTGAGMMDCKKALEEAGGDMAKAQELIRERGKAIANKRSDRTASEGVALAATADGLAGIIILNCETDFVAKNADFVALTEKLLKAGMDAKVQDLEALKALKIDGTTAEELVSQQSGITGEKMELSAWALLSGEGVACYNHPGNRLAAAVAFSKPLPNPELGFDIAMQVAGMNPVAIDENGVPKEIRDKEFEIGREQARLEGKPEQILDKIAEGRLNKFFKENTLLAQEFVKEGKISVEQYMAKFDKELRVIDFKRFSLGD